MRAYAAMLMGLWLLDCGGSSRREGSPRAAAGESGAGGLAATPSAGRSGAGRSGAGRSGTGGSIAIDTTTAGSSDGSMPGDVTWPSGLADGGAPPVEGDGFACDSRHCAAGELCVGCLVPQLGTGLDCVPDPRREPEAYAASDASHCMFPRGYIDCDGPEDCPPGLYCVLGAVGLAYGAQCLQQPPEPDRSCCFDCDAVVLPLCALCAVDSDCPAGNVCIPPPAGYRPDMGGCEPTRVQDCNSSTRWCCDRNVGAFVAAVCDPSTGTTHCSEGTVETPPGGACAPEGSDVESCDELDKLPCASVELECHTAARCSTFCSCELNGSSDVPTWNCTALAC